MLALYLDLVKGEFIANMTENMDLIQILLIRSFFASLTILESLLRTNFMVDRVGFEPTTSAMPMPYPTGLDDRPMISTQTYTLISLA